MSNNNNEAIYTSTLTCNMFELEARLKAIEARLKASMEREASMALRLADTTLKENSTETGPSIENLLKASIARETTLDTLFKASKDREAIMALRLADTTLKLDKSERLFRDTRDNLLDMEPRFEFYQEFYEKITECLNMTHTTSDQVSDYLYEIKQWVSDIKSTMDMESDEPREVLKALQTIYTEGIAPGNAIRDLETAARDKTIEDLKALVSADDKCSVCMENPRCMAFIGCGHRCVCVGCCPKLGLAGTWGEVKCPVCRQISAVIKIF